MAAWQASAGATLLIPSGAGKHLFVVLNDPVPFPGYGSQPCVVLVNVSTVRKGIPYDSSSPCRSRTMRRKKRPIKTRTGRPKISVDEARAAALEWTREHADALIGRGLYEIQLECCTPARSAKVSRQRHT